MKNEFVPYDIALVMKEIGFDEPCFGFYSLHDDNKAVGGNYPCDGTNSAPLFQQAFRWFREKHGLIAEFNWHFPSKCYATSIYPNNFYLQTKSYEEAELACLRKLIEIVKEKRDD